MGYATQGLTQMSGLTDVKEEPLSPFHLPKDFFFFKPKCSFTPKCMS